MFDNFESFDIETQTSPQVIIHGVKSQPQHSLNLPPLLLLHGFPQSHHIWHTVAPQLTNTYTVVALDLRGYGASSKPSELPEYAKSAMSRDCVRVMHHLGYDSFFICAHDRGARVAHKLCIDYPRQVKKAIFLDICPTLTMYSSTNFEFAKAYFHWFFLIQKQPLPETMISQNPRAFAEMFMGGRQDKGLDIFKKECFEVYVKGLGDAATVHAMCQDYRASASLDMEEAREDLKNNKMIQCPLKVIWGKAGVIEKCFDAIAEWKKVAVEGVDVQGTSIDCGHYIPEHAPKEVIRAIRDFLT